MSTPRTKESKHPIVNAVYIILGISSLVAAHFAGKIDTPWIALAAFLGAGTMLALAFRRKERVETPSLLDFQDWMITHQGGQRVMRSVSFSLMAAFFGWTVLNLDHGILRTMHGLVFGVLAYEAAVFPLVTLAFPYMYL